jgi:hypothetical protein
MCNTYRFMLIICMAYCASMSTSSVRGQYAAQVVSYNAGSTANNNFTTPSAALGSPSHFTSDANFPSVVSPFSPPFLSNQIVSVGEGGQITLQLSNYAMPQAGGLPELGIFGNVGVTDISYPNGVAGTPATTFSGIESANVEVSADGSNWFSFGNVAIDVPTNGYTDVSNPFSSAPGTNLSDFQQPFFGSLSNFDGKHYAPDMLNLLGSSGGGKWLDISATGLAKVGYVRFSIADDGNPNTKLKVEVDGLSVSHAAMGVAVVPEPATTFLFFIAIVGLSVGCRSARIRYFAEGSVPSPARMRGLQLAQGSGCQT